MNSLIFFFFFVPFLAFVLIMLNIILAPHKPYNEKASAFECGFHSFLGQNRSQFSISFFLFGLLFLIFDLEIVLIFPYAVSSNNNLSYGLTIVFIFIVILTAGFIFEIGKKALTINSKQTTNIAIGINLVLNSKYELVRTLKNTNLLKYYATSNNPNKKNIIKNMIKNALTINRLINFICIVLTGMFVRYLIEYYFGINVFKDLTHPISIIYYPFFSIWAGFLYKAIPLWVEELKIVVNDIMLNLKTKLIYINSKIKTFIKTIFFLLSNFKPKTLLWGEGEKNSTNNKVIIPDVCAMDSTRESSELVYKPKTKVYIAGREILLSDVVSDQNDLKKITVLEDIMQVYTDKAAKLYQDSIPLRKRLSILDGKIKADDSDINKAFIISSYGEDLANSRSGIVSKLKELAKDQEEYMKKKDSLNSRKKEEVSRILISKNLISDQFTRDLASKNKGNPSRKS